MLQLSGKNLLGDITEGNEGNTVRTRLDKQWTLLLITPWRDLWSDDGGLDPLLEKGVKI